MVDYSGLTNSNPNVTYDTSEFEAEGFKLEFAVDPENPVYNQVIDECTKQSLPYKLMDGEGRQKHIWIKGWKNV